jgi:hypothetical protein
MIGNYEKKQEMDEEMQKKKEGEPPGFPSSKIQDNPES